MTWHIFSNNVLVEGRKALAVGSKVLWEDSTQVVGEDTAVGRLVGNDEACKAATSVLLGERNLV